MTNEIMAFMNENVCRKRKHFLVNAASAHRHRSVTSTIMHRFAEKKDNF